MEEKNHGILVNMFDQGNLKTEQDPNGEGNPTMVVDGVVKWATLSADGMNRQFIRANQ
ncbi:hypothetical protein [Fredinandcohnia quinoae]|uniref:hypothetical protein n=1 Tax=Fredinandcohnia quinoae TaxID=2918902 RepID=UPI001F059F35|nr:hypothetical protein [Fredinandcohnia sp. SECRCQ15]